MVANIPPTKLKLELDPGAERALLREHPGEIGTSKLLMVPPSLIHIIPDFNLRVRETEKYKRRIQSIANSIQSEGFYQHEPVTCYIGKDEDDADTLWLTDGHCRMAALALLEATEGAEVPVRIPVMVVPKSSNQADLTVAMYKTGEPLTTYEMALGVVRLEKLGLTDEEIARRIDVSKRYLADLRSLLVVPTKIRNLLAADLVSATLVLQEVRERGPKEAAGVLAEAAKAVEGTGKRATKKDVQRAANGHEGGESEPGVPHEVKPGTYKLDFAATAGTEVPVTQIDLFAKLFGGDWYEHTTIGQVRMTSDIKIKMTVTRKLPEGLEEPKANEVPVPTDEERAEAAGL